MKATIIFKGDSRVGKVGGSSSAVMQWLEFVRNVKRMKDDVRVKSRISPHVTLKVSDFKKPQ